MRKFYRSLSVLFFVVTTGLFAQQPQKIELGENGTPRFIRFDTNLKSASTTTAEQVLKTQLKLADTDELKYVNAETDNLGFAQTRYQQYYKGIKVEYGQYKVHSKNGVIHSINGDFKIIDEGLSITPKFTEKQALSSALSFVGATKYIWEDADEELWAKTNEEAGTFYPKGELVVVENTIEAFGNKGAKQVLAYKFNIYAKEPLSRAYIYVDAQTGEIVHVNKIIKHVAADATATTRYSGTKTIKTDSYNSSYRLRDYTRGNGIIVYNLKNKTSYSSAVDFTDADNNWTATEYHNTAKDDAGLEAAWGFQVIHDYWLNVHGRNGYDNNGATTKVYVHYSTAYDNAYWNGSVFTFGDGSGTYFDALTSLDVSAHEHGHAVTEKTANLTYSYESGALNEGFSDIWGAAIEYYAAPEKKTWVMGEDIEKRSGHEGLRIMSNPKAEQNPSTYKGTYWNSGSSDNGGVHTNSGPITYWFYLISAGGSGTNDNGKAYSIQALGINKAEKISWRTLSSYLTASSNYSDTRIYAIQAAIDLYGAGSNEVIQVTNAFAAIGVGSDYIGTDTDAPSAPTNLVASNISATSLTLNWTASTDNIGVTGYDVYQNGSKLGTVTTATANITGLTASTTYQFYVRAKDAVGNISAASSTLSATTSSSTDTQAPTAPTNLAASGIAATSLTLNWAASSDNVGVTGYNVYLNGALIGTVTTTTANITGLTANTAYQFYVNAQDAAGNVSGASGTISVTTTTDQITYPASKGSNSNYEWIDLVKLGSINNVTSKNGGYADFTSLSTNLTRGTLYTINFSAGFASSTYTEYWAIWIDFNHDGDFVDAGEKIVSGSSRSAATLSSTFTVPTGAVLGSTRLRVSLKYNSAQTSTETFTYGEVEDYTVNIAATSFNEFNFAESVNDGEQIGNEEPSYSVFPNPVKDVVKINAHEKGIYYVKVINQSGQIVKNTTLNNENNFDVSDLSKGIYLLQLNDGQKITSHKFIKQ
jgi:Zn-dependent metalloprotease/chitodextrinase